MARMWDRMAANGFQVPSDVNRNHPEIAEAVGDILHQRRDDVVVVNMDPVARWMYGECEEDHWNMSEHFPYVRSPFDVAFYECRLPRIMRNRKGYYRGTRDWWGFFLSVHERGYYMEHMVKRSGEYAGEGTLGEELSSKYDPRIDAAKWITEIVMFFELEDRKGEVMGPIATWFVPCMEDGSPLRSEEGKALYKVLPMLDESNLDIQAAPNGVLDRSVIEQGMAPFTDPVFMSISLMHCKNVTVETSLPPAPLSKKWRKKTGRGLVTTKTLEIEPVASAKKSEGTERGRGVAKHLRRGHFKTFGANGRGKLFGRYEGTYWWGPRFVGDLEYGQVNKDYRVKGGSV